MGMLRSRFKLEKARLIEKKKKKAVKGRKKKTKRSQGAVCEAGRRDTVVSSSPRSEAGQQTKRMSDKAFLAFMKSLSYYNIEYMNFKMVVGINEKLVDESVNVVMNHIKKAIRSQIYAEAGAMTARSIVKSSKYGLDEVRIVGLAPILKPIDERVMMPL